MWTGNLDHWNTVLFCMKPSKFITIKFLWNYHWSTKLRLQYYCIKEIHWFRKNTKYMMQTTYTISRFIDWTRRLGIIVIRHTWCRLYSTHNFYLHRLNSKIGYYTTYMMQTIHTIPTFIDWTRRLGIIGHIWYRLYK